MGQSASKPAALAQNEQQEVQEENLFVVQEGVIALPELSRDVLCVIFSFVDDSSLTAVPFVCKLWAKSFLHFRTWDISFKLRVSGLAAVKRMRTEFLVRKDDRERVLKLDLNQQKHFLVTRGSSGQFFSYPLTGRFLISRPPQCNKMEFLIEVRETINGRNPRKINLCFVEMHVLQWSVTRGCVFLNPVRSEREMILSDPQPVKMQPFPLEWPTQVDIQKDLGDLPRHIVNQLQLMFVANWSKCLSKFNL